MMLPEAAVGSSHLVDMLRRHYLPDGRPPGGIFAAEIESPDGRRRGDVIWAPWSIAGDRGLVGHEIKVSRSDILTELADPMKAEPWARYCSRWWLVVADPGLVAGLDVPDSWGIMSPPAGRRRRTMTVVRPAPMLEPADTGPGWRRVASWAHFRHATRLQELEYSAARHKADAEYARRELADRQAQELGRTDRRAVLVGRVILELERRRWRGGEFPVDEVVEAIVDLDESRRLARRAREEIGWIVDQARRITAPMGLVADELEHLATASVPHGTQKP